MYTPFNEMPKEARIWIYQSNRKLSEQEVADIHDILMQFVEQWAAHSTPLKASFEIKYDRFIILAVDAAYHAASGCSIDASVKMIQEIEQKYEIDLLDKMNVTFRTGEFIAHKPLIDFKKMAKSKAVNAQTIVFNNLVNTIEEYENYWEVPAEESWHGRFF